MKGQLRSMMLIYLTMYSSIAFAVLAIGLPHADVASIHGAMPGVSLVALCPPLFGRRAFPPRGPMATIPGRIGSPRRDINHSTPRSSL
jgi:hypothetical protein